MPFPLLLLLLTVFVIMLLVSALLINLGARMIIIVALNRKLPKIFTKKASLNKITGCDPFFDTLNEKGKKLRATETETVTIHGHGGVKLVGHVLSAESPKRVIIAVHGWRGTWSRDFGIVSDFWQESDNTVIYVEQRAQNESEGEYITFGLLERYDILEWIKWANARYKNLPIYLCGVSMGASTVLMSADLAPQNSVRGIIADSGFTSPTEIWSYVVRKNLHLPYNMCKKPASKLCKKITGYSSDACSTEKVLKKCQTPILFIHGTDDSFVPVEMTYRNYRVCSAPKRLFVVPGANHGMSYYIDPDGYQREMERFFLQYD